MNFLTKTKETIPLILIGIVLPLVGKLEMLKTWPVLVLIVLGICLNFSQPSMTLKKEAADNHDRNSLILILVGALFCFAIPLLDFAYGVPKLIELNHSCTILGISMIWIGFAFRYWSIQVLDRFFTTKVVIQSDHQLVRTGPYKYFRHPSYLGNWISMMGISVLFQSMLGMVFSGVVYLMVYYYRIKCEEKALAGMFPSEYVKYKRDTWGMLPYIF